jgi:queuine/archaeosine tRNA-ribosyltransferase
MGRIRDAIEFGTFEDFAKEFLQTYSEANQ